MRKVVLIGGGVLGSQIAYQSAYCGFAVTMYLRSEQSIERAKPKLERLHEIYIQELRAAKEQQAQGIKGYVSRGLVQNKTDVTAVDFKELLDRADAAYQAVYLTTDLQEAVAGADLVIEALSENAADKIAFFEKMAPLLEDKTILVTNSSTLLPSKLAASTGRPEKFLALHFANNIWRQNTAEIMGHAKTTSKAYETVCQFAKDIAMIPLRLNKEQPGYILNSMLVPFLSAAEALLVKEVADVETIDKTWKLATGAPKGPFEILDIVGIATAYNIVANSPDAKDENSLHGKIAKLLKEEYLDKGKTGIAVGEGFYKY